MPVVMMRSRLPSSPFTFSSRRGVLRGGLLRNAATALLIIAMLQACGEADPPHGAPDPGTCEDDPRADSYVANMVEAGANGHFKVRLVESDPAPPAKGSNAWTLQLLDAQDAPVDGATILVTPFMPDHGHGTSIDAVVAPTGSAGGYVAAPINLSMPGLWEVTLDVESAGTRDKVVLAFCIEG